MRVLVTGATGFIGRHALEPLCGIADEVHAITSHGRRLDDAPDVNWHTADLLAGDPARLIAETSPTHLLHLAWYAEPGKFWNAAENLAWVGATLKLVRAFSAGGGQRVVGAGTCAEYAWEAVTHCVEQQTPLVPATLYGSAKRATHMTLEAYCNTVGVDLAWGRVFFVFGPNERPERLVGSVASRLVAGSEALCTDGEQVRDFLFAPELASAFVALLAADVVGPVNMASGVPLRIRDLVEAVGRAAESPERVHFGAVPRSDTEPMSLTADVTRLRSEVGWSPSLSLAEAISQTVDWWKAELE